VPYELPPLQGVGWGLKGMEATLPINPRKALFISGRVPSGMIRLSPKNVEEVNLRTACFSHKEIYSSRKLDIIKLKIPQRKPMWPSLF
jgi:hypothetical protein